MSLNDELFAIRIALQDSYPDEKDIIRQLKIYLRNNNTPTSEIDQKIIDFYKAFNINFPEDFISEININPPLLATNSIASFLLGEPPVYSSIQELDGIEEEIDNSSDSDDETDDDMPDLEELPLEDNFNMPSISFQLPADPSNLSSNLNNVVNILANPSLGNHSINFQNIQTPDQFFTTFNNLLSSINIPAQPNMEDVKVTLDEKDADNIETSEAKEDMNIKCSICMMGIKKVIRYQN